MADDDYTYETPDPLEARAVKLEEQARDARAEADHARSVGLDGPAAAATAEAERLSAEADDLRRVVDTINAGFPFWEREGFEEALEALGDPWVWETVSEVVSDTLVYSHDTNVRMPIEVQRDYGRAKDSRLFDRFELCSMFETSNDVVEHASYCLFGVRELAALPPAPFLVAQWQGRV